MTHSYVIYGASGYTGELIVRAAAARGHRPVVAGRSEAKIRPLADALGLPWRAFSLDDPAAVDKGLEGAAAVLNCAGPFSRTAGPMVVGCLRRKVHYLDVTGEIDVFEAIARRDAEAQARGVMLLPGVGFDVVPSDCLAAHLKARLPAASRLALGFVGITRVSHGTATTMAENAARGGLVRKGGRLTVVPAAWKTRTIDFGRGPMKALTLPWGDVSTAYYSTGIPDIEVYFAAPAATRLLMRATRRLGWLLRGKTAQAAMVALLSGGAAGPDAVQRARGQSLLWGEAADDAGRRVVSRLSGPEAYSFTVLTALAAVEAVLRGQTPSGFMTPSRAFGADFVLSITGVARQDL